MLLQIPLGHHILFLRSLLNCFIIGIFSTMLANIFKNIIKILATKNSPIHVPIFMTVIDKLSAIYSELFYILQNCLLNYL